MKPTLLIAEGDAELRDVYHKFLTGRGYHVETASDGLGCLEKLRRADPAVFILDRDLRWGGSDGVLAWLREGGARRELRVVLTATAEHSASADGAAEPPVVRYLHKPFALAALLECVRAALGEPGRDEPFDQNRAARPDFSVG